jgi:hypothetical protein
MDLVPSTLIPRRSMLYGHQYFIIDCRDCPEVIRTYTLIVSLVMSSFKGLKSLIMLPK